jgi:hypothetical protein
LTSFSVVAETISLAVLLYNGGVQREVTAVVATIVAAVVLAVLTVVAAILAVVLPVVLTIVLTIVTTVLAIVLTVVLAELGLGNAGCKQHRQQSSEAHDVGKLVEQELRVV